MTFGAAPWQTLRNPNCGDHLLSPVYVYINLVLPTLKGSVLEFFAVNKLLGCVFLIYRRLGLCCPCRGSPWACAAHLCTPSLPLDHSAGLGRLRAHVCALPRSVGVAGGADKPYKKHLTSQSLARDNAGWFAG